MNDPLVSIVITTTGARAAMLEDAVRSVARQSWPRVELVVVFDAPEMVRTQVDAVKAIWLEGARDSDALALSTTLGRRGRAVAANMGVGCARGELVGFLDDDDVLRSWHVERLVNGLRDYPAAGASYCDVSVMLCDEKNKPRSGVPVKVFTKPFTKERLRVENQRPNMAFLFRRELLVASQLDARAWPVDDWDLLLTLVEKTTFAYVPGVGGEYRIRADGSNSLAKDRSKIAQALAFVREKHGLAA